MFLTLPSLGDSIRVLPERLFHGFSPQFPDILTRATPFLFDALFSALIPFCNLVLALLVAQVLDPHAEPEGPPIFGTRPYAPVTVEVVELAAHGLAVECLVEGLSA